MKLESCLENLKMVIEKETSKKQKYFKIKKVVEVKEEKLNMVGRNYLRNKQQYEYKMNLRKKHTTKKIRKVVSKADFDKALIKEVEAEEKRKKEIEERKQLRQKKRDEKKKK